MSCYKDLYQALLEPFQEQLWEHKLTSAPIMVGEEYEKSPFRLMYVGRAVNGWEFAWHKDTLEGLTDQVFAHGFRVDDICSNPIQADRYNAEAKGYNYNCSPFWQLCHKLFDLVKESEDWSGRVAWSNLFKVAPFKRGNPNKEVIVKSIQPCIALMKEEIRQYHPSHIVFVTDSWWLEPADYTPYSFAKDLGISLKPDSSNTVVGSGIYQGAKIVVTKRPETARVSREEHARQILDAFSKL